MDLNLNGRRAFVCGSTQGIGKAIALELALLGANVTLVARNESKLEKVLDCLVNDGGQEHDFICADFDDPNGLKSQIEKYIKIRGAEILINNTGGPPGGPAHTAELDEFKSAFDRHLICNQILTQALIPFMKEAGYGRIINIISTSVKAPLKGLGVSNTIRGAVANWAKTLSVELAPDGITVNNVLPGSTSTERIAYIIRQRSEKSGESYEEIEESMKGQVPAGRFAEPEEVASAAAFLASPAAAYINGINLPVDGGRTPSL